jgi:hypothetical protein
MIVSIMQPGYLPWLGFFELVACSDIFVIYDDVNYDKGSWRNRNKIRTPEESSWITVPVLTKNNFGQKIKDVCINNNTKWSEKHIKSIVQNYGKGSFFGEYISFFEQVYTQHWDKLIELDMVIIDYLVNRLCINTKMIRSSQLEDITGAKTDRLVSICKQLKAEKYISPNGAKPYLETDKFLAENIDVRFQNYEHPVYPQVFKGFISHLSVIDLIFNCGDRSLEVIMSGSTIKSREAQ